MKTVEEYLRLMLLSKGSYIENGEIINETKSGRENSINTINWVAPLIKDYSHKVLLDFCNYLQKTGSEINISDIEDYYAVNKCKTKID